jgi:hypothetical protein
MGCLTQPDHLYQQVVLEVVARRKVWLPTTWNPQL